MTSQGQEPAVRITTFRPELAPAFDRLNRAWIASRFTLEPRDEAYLGDPQGHVIDQGGEVFFALYSSLGFQQLPFPGAKPYVDADVYMELTLPPDPQAHPSTHPMTDLAAARDENHRSVDDFLAAARSLDQDAWQRSPAAGKWSPAQVTEHVTLAYERTREMLHSPSPAGIPFFLRPLIRFLYVRPILKSGRFPKSGKAPRPFRPSGTPTSSEALCARLRTAADGIEADVEQLASLGEKAFDHPVFGSVKLPDCLRFLALHTTHHRRQLFPASR